MWPSTKVTKDAKTIIASICRRICKSDLENEALELFKTIAAKEELKKTR